MNLSPYKLAAQIAGMAIGVALLVALVMSWSARGQEIESLERWRGTVIQAATVATVEPDAKGNRAALVADDVPASIASLKRSFDSCQNASAERTRIADEQKKRADAADQALANVQTIMRGEYSSAAKRIAALQAVKAAPTPELQCQATAADSKAAWEAWK